MSENDDGFEKWWSSTLMTEAWIEKPIFRKDVVRSWSRQAWKECEKKEKKKLAEKDEQLMLLAGATLYFKSNDSAATETKEIEDAFKVAREILGKMNCETCENVGWFEYYGKISICADCSDHKNEAQLLKAVQRELAEKDDQVMLLAATLLELDHYDVTCPEGINDFFECQKEGIELAREKMRGDVTPEEESE